MPDENEGTPEGTPDEPEALGTPPETPPVEPSAPEVETFDRKYVEDLRTESAKYRKRAQTAEETIKEHDLAQMGELEQAQAKQADAEKQVEQTNRLLSAERTRNAVTLEATRMDFRDASDALAMIEIGDLNYDEETGRPSVKSVKGALDKLVKAKPYLVAGDPQPGTADGGARGDAGDLTYQQTVDQYEKEIMEQGRTVPMPQV